MPDPGFPILYFITILCFKIRAPGTWCPMETVVYRTQYSPGYRTRNLKVISLTETTKFPFWGLNICVDFDLGDFKVIENMKKLN